MNKMEKGYTKVNDNIYFRSRKEAAMYDERLSSRERASELLGVSVSSLADYELGNTKVVPVDKVDLMAQLYKAPQLRTQYCKAECPIGKRRGEEPAGGVFSSLLDIVRCKTCFFCHLLNDLRVIARDPQLFRNLFADGAPAAAKLTADGNDSVFHLVFPFQNVRGGVGKLTICLSDEENRDDECQ